jgi:hypothetical protein
MSTLCNSSTTVADMADTAHQSCTHVPVMNLHLITTTWMAKTATQSWIQAAPARDICTTPLYYNPHGCASYAYANHIVTRLLYVRQVRVNAVENTPKAVRKLGSLALCVSLVSHHCALQCRAYLRQAD